MNSAVQALTLPQPTPAAAPRTVRAAPRPAMTVSPPPSRRRKPRTEQLAIGALVVAAHVAGGLGLAYLAAQKVEPPQVRPIEIAFITVEAPPQPEPAPPAPPAPPEPVRETPPPKKLAPTPPKPVRPTPVKPAPAPEPTLTQSESALSAQQSEPAPPQEAAPPPAPPAPPAPAAAPAAAPVVAARFDADYLNNPSPTYPPLSRRLREEGKVMLRVLVTVDGKPGQVEIATSSGFERLDNAARQAVQRWRFVPARQGERAVEASVLVPIVFKLEG